MLHFASNWIAIGLRRKASRSQPIDTVGTPTRTAEICGLLFATVLLAGVSLAPLPASANCTIGLSSTSCDTAAPNPYTGAPIGTGPDTPSPYNVLLNQGAQIRVINKNAITLGDNATITLNPGAVVQTTTTTSDGGQGPYHRGWDAIEVNHNGTITVSAGASVIATGVGPTSEAINPVSFGNTIINHGLIAGGPSSPIVFENVNSNANSPRNTVLNFGTISTSNSNRDAIGSDFTVGIDFVNEPGGVIQGNLGLQGGNDNVTLFAGSKIAGNLDGGGGANTLALDGAAGTSDTMSANLTNFGSLTKNGAGAWTLSGTATDNLGAQPLNVTVQNGQLILTGNNPGFRGSVLVDPGGTLQLGNGGTTGSIGGNVTDNGMLVIDRSNLVTLPGVISGTGALTLAGTGTTVLTADNTFTGGTTISAGTLQLGNGGTTGSIVGNITR